MSHDANAAPTPPAPVAPLEIDALFVLGCGCILDGCSGSHPGRVWRAGGAGTLACTKDHPYRWSPLVDVVYLHAPPPVSPPPVSPNTPA